MKKLTAWVVTAAMTGSLLLGGCGGTEETQNAAPAAEATTAAAAEATADTEAQSDTWMQSPDQVQYQASDYVKLGDYKNLSVEVEGDFEVTPEDVEEAIQNRVLAAGDLFRAVDKEAAELGDVVNIDYEGKKDGVAFDGGTAQGYDLELGSGSFIDGFEDGLVGAKVGETRELQLTFPEQYHSEDLAGQDVVFTVTVNEIKERVEVTADTLTDEYVKEKFGASSAESWKQSVEEEEKAEAEEQKETELSEAIVVKLKDICEVTGIPEGLLEERKKQTKEYYESQAKQNGVELSALLSYYGMTEEMLDQFIDENAEDDVNEELILSAIADELGLDENSDAFRTYVDGVVKDGGYGTEDALYAMYPKSYVLRMFRMKTAMDELKKTTKVQYVTEPEPVDAAPAETEE